MSTAVALFVSPVTISFCRRKSTRVTAVLGGLVTALGCLFTSFATQFHQLFFSYGTVIGKRINLSARASFYIGEKIADVKNNHLFIMNDNNFTTFRFI
jgi:hypothetical protein